MSSEESAAATPRTFPDLARVFRQIGPKVSDTFDAASASSFPNAHQATLAQFRKGLADLLATVATTMERGAAADGAVDASASAETPHGDPSIKLSEIVAHFGLLRQALVSEASAALGRQLSSDETLALCAALDAQLKRNVVAFVDTMGSQVQAVTNAHGKYLSFLSHDLRGGLNGIFLMIEVLKRELAGQPALAEAMDDLDLMRASLMDTVATMDRFLYAERLQQGKIVLRPTTLSLKTLAGERFNPLAASAREKGLDVRIDVDAALSVIGDRELLGLILHGLLASAVKRSRSGGVVSMTAVDDKESCEVRIADAGPPRPKEDDADLALARQAAPFLKATLSRADDNASALVLRWPKQGK